VTAGGPGTTQVSVGSLEQLRSSLQDILNQVNAQLSGQAPEGQGPVVLSRVDGDMVVKAGCQVEFNAAVSLNAALSAMGGSVQDQLIWLSGVLTAMIGEINTSIGSLTSTETLNVAQVNTLIGEFANTLGLHYKTIDPIPPPVINPGEDVLASTATFHEAVEDPLAQRALEASVAVPAG
jgi:hypothetical protein